MNCLKATAMIVKYNRDPSHIVGAMLSIVQCKGAERSKATEFYLLSRVYTDSFPQLLLDTYVAPRQESDL